MLFLTIWLAAIASAEPAGVPPIGRVIEVSIPGKASIWYEPPIVGLDSPETVAVAAEAVRLYAADPDFPRLFAGLCRLAAAGPGRSRGARARTADLFRGLIRWTRAGGAPRLQGRSDWPLHFAYGGYLAATYGGAAADAAAVAKEERDALTPDNGFDLGDLAVTLIGARWAELAASRGLAWFAEWGSGARSLAALPAVDFPKLPQGRQPDAGALLRVRRFARSAL